MENSGENEKIKSITHDLININQEVLSVLELLLHNPDLPEQLRGLVKECVEEVGRGTKLITELREIQKE